VALLIGNAAYTSGMPALTYPLQDIQVLEQSLKKLNFEVQVVRNADQKAMGRAIRDFGSSAREAQVALVYYSGHGMQARDENYLIPIGATIESEGDLDIEAIQLRALLRQIEDARPKTTVVVLDACRDNPVASRTKSGSKGLSRVQNQPGNTLVVFAAQAGATATDNGVFAKELATRIVEPNVGIRSVFDKVGQAVRQATGQRQSIQRDDQLSEDVVLLGGVAAPPLPRVQTIASQADPEEEAWNATKAANTARAYDAYLEEYPRGRYASAARIARSGFASAAPIPAPAPTPVPQPVQPIAQPSPARPEPIGGLTQTPSPSGQAAPDMRFPGGRAISIVVPFAAGGATDILARAVAQELSGQLGAPVVIDNRGGAGGNVGAEFVSRAAPDGFTLMFHNTALASAPGLYKAARHLSEFETLGVAAEMPMLLVASPFVPINDAGELSRYLKSNPGKVTLGNAGIGSLSYLCGALLGESLGGQMTHVPYRGTASAVTELISGQLNLFCGEASFLDAHVASGKVKVIGLVSSVPSPMAATRGLPSLGLRPDSQLSNWVGLYAPRGTPAGVVSRINTALKVAVQSSAFRQKLEPTGAVPVTDTRLQPSGHRQFLDAQSARLVAVVRAIGVTAD
jgi:tripartite-type tricarboxylate transporter receptor subunit TctC/uncharacterized caspase-like protein